MKYIYVLLIIFLSFLMLPVVSAFGQPPPPPPQDIPLDGGLLFLLFSGVGLIIKSFVSKKKKNI